MTNITNIDDHRPHYAVHAICVGCGFNWVAVVDARHEGMLECSKCGAMAGKENLARTPHPEGLSMSRYQPSYSIEFTPHAEWRKFATGKARGYRWWVAGPLSFHVTWTAAPEPLGADNPDMKGTPLK